MQFMNSIVDDVSINLNDQNFEHETQAATGATTGDWFIYFYSPHCMKCKFMSPEWKFFAERMKEQQVPVNIAKVDVEANPQTVRRLRVFSFPTYLYFKGGFYYNYTGPVVADSLDAVVKQEQYLDYPKKEVPGEMTVLRDWYLYLRWWTIKLWAYLAAGAVAVCVLVGLVVMLCRKKTVEVAPQKKKED